MKLNELDTYLALRTAIVQEPGLIRGHLTDFHSNSCAVGSLVPREQRATFRYKVGKFTESAIDDTMWYNDSFFGSFEARREHVLKWLDEKINQLQRSDLAVPSFEEPVLT